MKGGNKTKTKMKKKIETKSKEQYYRLVSKLSIFLVIKRNSPAMTPKFDYTQTIRDNCI